MALNRNHSQEGGVVVPNAERYRRPGASSLPSVPSAGPGRRGPVVGGSRWGEPRSLPAAQARLGRGSALLKGSLAGRGGLRGQWGAGLAGVCRAAPTSPRKLRRP